MNQPQDITIPVQPATAEILSDPRNREAAGRFLDRLVTPGYKDPLIALFEKTAAQAAEAGFTEADLEAELAAYNAERRS